MLLRCVQHIALSFLSKLFINRSNKCQMPNKVTGSKEAKPGRDRWDKEWALFPRIWKDSTQHLYYSSLIFSLPKWCWSFHCCGQGTTRSCDESMWQRTFSQQNLCTYRMCQITRVVSHRPLWKEYITSVWRIQWKRNPVSLMGSDSHKNSFLQWPHFKHPALTTQFNPHSQFYEVGVIIRPFFRWENGIK